MASEVIAAVEPALEIVELRSITFEKVREEAPKAWFCLSRRRSVAAQPSTRW